MCCWRELMELMCTCWVWLMLLDESGEGAWGLMKFSYSAQVSRQVQDQGSCLPESCRTHWWDFPCYLFRSYKLSVYTGLCELICFPFIDSCHTSLSMCVPSEAAAVHTCALRVGSPGMLRPGLEHDHDSSLEVDLV